MAQVTVELKQVSKQFSKALLSRGKSVEEGWAVHEVSFTAPPGKLTALLGPSGCGKTTLLRLVAGLEEPTGGEILFNGKSVLGVPPQKRHTALVFQSYALFPHLTVFENIAFGLRLRKKSSDRISQQVQKILETVGLLGLENRKPRELSGGQQQRVALARALVIEPSVLLFDEPLSNLDASLREKMRLEIKRVQKEVGLTSLYVTHDREEAMALAAQVVVLNRGSVEQISSPEEVYQRPKSKFVAQFVGKGSFFEVQVLEQSGGQALVELWGRTLSVPALSQPAAKRTGELLVRPEHILVTPPGEGLWEGRVAASMYLGPFFALELSLAGGVRLEAHLPRSSFAEGDSVGIAFQEEACWLLPKEK